MKAPVGANCGILVPVKIDNGDQSHVTVGFDARASPVETIPKSWFETEILEGADADAQVGGGGRLPVVAKVIKSLTPW